MDTAETVVQVPAAAEVNECSVRGELPTPFFPSKDISQHKWYEESITVELSVSSRNTHLDTYLLRSNTE